MEEALSVRLKKFLRKHEDLVSPQARSNIAETIDIVEYYEMKEARESRNEPYIDRATDA